MTGDPADAVRGYYRVFAEQEAGRLHRPDDGAVEREIHARALTDHLPPAPARVLDDGGGPGHWAYWLAERGYRVSLTDLSPELLDLARARASAHRLADIVEADARDLSRYPDRSFDAVLCLGPLYHLPEREDRRRALREARRVLRPGGVLLAAVMPRYLRLAKAVLERGAAAFASGAVQAICRTGRYDDDRPGRFTGGHLTTPDEVRPLFASCGFEVRAVLASQGFLGWAQAGVAELAERDPDAYRRLLDLAYRTAGDPSIHGMAGHLLVVAR